MRLLLPSQTCWKALVVVLTALPLAAQQSDSEIRQDIEFARGLAASWGFTDMSEAVLARLEKQNPGGRVGEEIQLLKCDIYAISAGRVADRARRDQLLKTALIGYEQYIGSHSSAENRTRAEEAYVETALNYGRSLSAAAEDAVGAELESIKKDLQDQLSKSASRTAALANDLRNKQPRTEDEDRKLFELLMNRATLLLLIARSQTDGTFNFEQAKQNYEQVVDLAGETSSAGLRAFIGVGDVYFSLGKPKDAYDCYGFVGEVAIPRDAAAWAEQAKELPSEEIQRRFALLQLATPGMIQALMASGDTAKACAEGVRLLNVWNHEGLELVPPYGYQSLLGIVGAFNEAGGFIGGELEAGTLEWFAGADTLQAKFPQKRQQRSALDLALTLAQTVSDDNRGNTYGARAQRLIGEIIEQPGVEVSPQILIEAARGKASDRDYLGAIGSYKRVLNALEFQDASVRTEFAPKVLNAIGRCYQALERPLEAALVFQEALTTFKGDAQFDSQNANGFYVSANQLKRKLKDDPLIDALSKSANQAKLDNPGEGGGAGEIMYANASRALDQDKDYATARDLFKRVPTDAESYEKALVYVGVCEYMLGQPKRDFAAAIGVFDDYLDQYLKDPRHALGPTETRKEFRRGEATAVAVYYRGLSEFYLAEAGKGDWKRVVDLLSGFETRFPAQKDLAPAAMYRVILAQCHLGKQQEVDAGYVRLRELFASNKFTVMAAQEIFGMLDADFGKLKDSKDPADRVKAKALQAKMAEYLEFANQNSSTPSFNNLRRESQLWRDLERWPKAESLLRKLEEKYASGPNAADVQKYVLPDLGVACFKQQKMQDAVDILGPLVEQKKATFAITLVYAHALSGYAEQVTLENQSSMRVVAGVASLDAFTKATELYGELLETEKNRDGGGAWTSGWLELKFDQIYCLHEWSKIDSKRAESALTQIKSLQTEFDGPELPSLKDADLKAKFKWLIGELK